MQYAARARSSLTPARGRTARRHRPRRPSRAKQSRKDGTVNASTAKGSTRRRSGTACALLGTIVAGLLALPGAASAAKGALTQLPSASGCISEDGSGPCTDGDLLNGAFSVAVSKDGKNAYVALVDGHAVAALGRDRSTGALTQLPSPHGCIGESHAGLCSDGRGLIAPVSVVISND